MAARSTTETSAHLDTHGRSRLAARRRLQGPSVWSALGVLRSGHSSPTLIRPTWEQTLRRYDRLIVSVLGS